MSLLAEAIQCIVTGVCNKYNYIYKNSSLHKIVYLCIIACVFRLSVLFARLKLWLWGNLFCKLYHI